MSGRWVSCFNPTYVHLFFPASLGIISQIFPPENLSAAILALGTLGMCMEQARMAAVDLVEIAQFQEKISDPRLDRFFIVTISTIVLKLSGFYLAVLWIGWGALIVLVSQIWFHCLAKIQLQPTTEKIIDYGIVPRLPILLADYMDGLEYFNGKLISNRCDACGVYDIYDTNGNLLQAAFITAPAAATGIAYDGTDFYVSNVYNSSIGVYDEVLGTLKSTINLIPKTPGDTFLIEDLSVDYLQRPDTGRVPEPASVLGLLAIGVLGAGSALTRKLLK
ncbi:MAG: PEP-CTERM sorting domain-containing protein [Microcystis aeruginosa PMC 728.11]|nr:PEP-CTERM sorting domain-containing protein [Microcystis aeruginosa PMC 728.11]